MPVFKVISQAQSERSGTPYPILIADIDPCPRCRLPHSIQNFRLLLRPSQDINYWSICPITFEPILVMIDGPGGMTCRLERIQ